MQICAGYVDGFGSLFGRLCRLLRTLQDPLRRDGLGKFVCIRFPTWVIYRRKQGFCGL